MTIAAYDELANRLHKGTIDTAAFRAALLAAGIPNDEAEKAVVVESGEAGIDRVNFRIGSTGNIEGFDIE